MVHIFLFQFIKRLSFIAIISSLMLPFSVFGTSMSSMLEQKNNTVGGYLVGNIIKSSGWYERYPNGQIVLYPVVRGSTMSQMSSMPSMSSMYGMLGMTGMMSSMLGMNSMMGMGGMPSMSAMGGMPSMSAMGGMPSMSAMGGMPSMSAMYGMSAMSGMLGITSMYGISPGGYQMTFGRFWIDKEGNLVLYPSNNIFYMWGMDGMESNNNEEGMKSMKNNSDIKNTNAMENMR